MKHFTSPIARPTARRSSGFTLVEVLVAVGIMSLLLAIILVPLRLGFDTFHIGTARASVQQQTQSTLRQIATDLGRAKFVFPNSYVANVSDNPDTTSPCSSPKYDPAKNYQPYVIESALPSASTDADPSSGSYGICSGTVPWSNPARLDMLQLRGSSANGLEPGVGEDFVVSYYARRIDLSKAYDIVDNPVVLYRAQIPYRYFTGTQFQSALAVAPATPPAGSLNAILDWTSVAACTASAKDNREHLWTTHNIYGEANLEPLAQDSTTGQLVPGAHTLATPRGMGLVVPRSNYYQNGSATDQSGALVPDMSFVQEGDNGRINRVTINMNLAQYDNAGAGSVNGQAAAQRVRISQTVDLPNVGCSP